MKKLFRLATGLVTALFIMTITAPVSAEVLINEFMAAPVSIESADGQWIELVNTSIESVSVNNWTINDAAIDANTLIPANGFAVICLGQPSGDIVCDGTADLILSPGGQNLTLLNDEDELQDSFEYEGADVDVEVGASTEVIQTATDPALNVASDAGTPGAANSLPDNTVRNQRTGVVYGSIQAAVDAAEDADTLAVAPGTYNETITINQALTLSGVSRDAIVNGSLSIASDDVTVSGLTVSNPNGSYGILISGRSNVTITDNTIQDIGIALATGSAQAIYLNAGSGASISDVELTNNTITNIGSLSLAFSGVPGSGTSAEAIYVGNTAGSGTITGLNITSNIISNVFASTAAWNVGRGAYGVLVNFGGTTSATISNNTITTLEGLWSHGIGLERNTPATTLSNNTITGLSDHKGGTDSHAIFFESNPSKTSVVVNGQTLGATTAVAVNSDWVGYENNPVVTLNGISHIYGVNAFATVNDGVTAVDVEGTVNVAAGTYTEQVTINRSLTLDGVSDDAVTGTIINSVGSGSNIIVSANDVTVNDVLVKQTGLTGNGIDVSGTNINNLALNRVTATGGNVGLRAGTATNITNLDITDSHFDGNTFGLYFAKELISSSAVTITDVTVTNTTFDNNLRKGIYAEKLDNATFTGGSANNSGTDPSYAYNSGVDINLKFGSYSNIVFRNFSATGSGLAGAGSQFDPAAITIKARDDGATYGALAATLDSVTLDGVIATGGVVGVRLGEQDKNNATPTNVMVTKSSLIGSGGFGWVNATQANATIGANWWGSTTPDFSAIISGSDTVPTSWYINSGRTILNSTAAIEDDEVTVDDGELELPADTPGTAQLPTSTEVLTFNAGATLNLNQNTQTATVTVVDSTPTVSIGGSQVNQTQTIGNQSVVLEKQVTLQSGTGNSVKIKSSAAAVSNVTVEIPNNTTIYASNSWDGIIKPPTAVVVASTETAPAGFSFGSTALKVGSDTETLVFDEVVTLLLEGVSSQVGYKAVGSTQWQLIATCGGSYDSPVLPTFPGECSRTDGTDTKILTFHFTEFAAVQAASTTPPANNTTSSPAATPASTSTTTAQTTGTDTSQVASEQAATSSTATEEDTSEVSQNVAQAANGETTLKWWYWVLVVASLLGVIYYLAGERIREKLVK